MEVDLNCNLFVLALLKAVQIFVDLQKHFCSGTVQCTALYITHCIAHCTFHYIMYYTLFITHSKIFITRSPLHTDHLTLDISNCTLYTANFTLPTAHSTHIVNCTRCTKLGIVHIQHTKQIHTAPLKLCHCTLRRTDLNDILSSIKES